MTLSDLHRRAQERVAFDGANGRTILTADYVADPVDLVWALVLRDLDRDGRAFVITGRGRTQAEARADFERKLEVFNRDRTL